MGEGHGNVSSSSRKGSLCLTSVNIAVDKVLTRAAACRSVTSRPSSKVISAGHIRAA